MDTKKRNLVLGLVAGVMFVGAGVMLAKAWRSGAREPTRVDVEGVCVACQKEVKAGYALAPAPHRCPHCGEDAVFAWMFCNACEMRFVPNLEVRDGTARLPMMPRCPKCGGAQVEMWLAEVEGTGAYKSRGDIPLPPWPPK